MEARTTGAVAPDEMLEVLAIARASCSPPTLRSGVIPRDAVVKRLCDSDDRPVVAVSAPPGYGKSTTMALWSEADPRPFCWVHLDALDDDPLHLARHIAAALHPVAPLPVELVRHLTGAGRSVDLDVVPSLSRYLGGVPPLVLVLDDVHVLTSTGAHRSLEGVLSRIPDGSQVALVGRSLPDLHLARRRLADDVVDLTSDDLAMDNGEATALFDRAGLVLDSDSTDRLLDQTEGWPGGLHLAALALRERPDLEVRQAFSGRDRLVADYLMEEVLARLPGDTVTFLTRSSVLDRMSASLLDEVLGADDSGRRLVELERSGNLFLIPLDREREWFRYHHIFGEMLRNRLQTLEPGEAVALQRRASRALERTGDIDAAVRHAVAAGETDRAADLVLEHTMALLDRGEVGRLDQWLGLLGTDALRRHPSAAIAAAWYGVSTGATDVIGDALDAAAAMDPAGPLADGTPSLAVAVAAIRMMAAPAGLPGILRDTALIREAGGPDTNRWWAIATGVRGTAASMAGELDEARSLLSEALDQLDDTPVFQAGLVAHLALLELWSGDLAAADRLSTRALAIVDRHDIGGVLPTIPVWPVAALVAARLGRVDDTRRHSRTAQRMLARLGGLSARTRVFGYVLLARAALTVGDRADARLLAAEADQARRRDPSPTFFVAQLDELLERLTRGADERNLRVAPLTAAELRVLTYLPTHLSLQEIADALLVSRNTAKSHSVAIYRKLGVSSRSDAVAEARRLGLLDG